MLKKLYLFVSFLFISINSFADNLSEGEYKNYIFNKIADYEYTLKLSIISGNCDFYGHHTGFPKVSNYHRSSTKSGSNDELFTFKSTVKSKYFISVFAKTACSFSTPRYSEKKIINSSTSNDSSCESKEGDINSIKDIPCLMEKKGWTLAADLMNYWFSGSGKNYMVDLKDIKDISDELTQVIKTYEKDASNLEIMTEKRWQALISDLKKTKNGTGGMIYPDGGKFNFIEQEIPSKNEGMMSFKHEQKSMHWINEDEIGSLSDLNAYSASIGEGVLRLVTDGKVIVGNDGYIEIKISKVGLYLRDSYDFSTHQFLGCWSHDLPRVTINPGWDRTCVSNGTFRKYNKSLHKSDGSGDFRIFSNMHILDVDESHRVGKYNILSSTDTEKKIKLYITKCINKFYKYFGDKVGSVYGCNDGYICQKTTGGTVGKVTLISIDNNLGGKEFKYLGGGYEGSLSLSYCN